MLKGKKDSIVRITRECLENGEEASYLLNEILIPGINEVGELFEKGKNLNQILDEFNIAVQDYEDAEKNKLTFWTYMRWMFMLSIFPIIFFLYVAGCNIIIEECFGVMVWIFLMLFTHKVYSFLERGAKKKKLNWLLQYIDEQQIRLDNDRKNFLESTKNVMLYWKRTQNLKDYEDEINRRKQRIRNYEKACLKRK